MSLETRLRKLERQRLDDAPSPLHADDAVLRTVNVEVKALTLNGKQMTLSVFRQLEKETLMNPFGVLKGTPWGRVNYFWGDCKDDHLHVVWQKGKELKRDCVRDWPTDAYPFLREYVRYPVQKELYQALKMSYSGDGFERRRAELELTLTEKERLGLAMMEQWYRTYQELSQLGQLFIAV